MRQTQKAPKDSDIPGQMTFDWSAATAHPVVKESKPKTETQRPSPTETERRTVIPKKSRSGKRKSPAVLPVPKPLDEAIGKGNFGEGEHGPIRPAAVEVRAITEQHAERLIEILSSLRDVEGRLLKTTGSSRPSLIQEKDKWLSAYQGGIALYAEDFGEPAAKRLDAYVRHELDKRSR